MLCIHAQKSQTGQRRLGELALETPRGPRSLLEQSSFQFFRLATIVYTGKLPRLGPKCVSPPRRLLCLLVNTLPTELAHRVLDCFLHEGAKVPRRAASKRCCRGRFARGRRKEARTRTQRSQRGADLSGQG